MNVAKVPPPTAAGARRVETPGAKAQQRRSRDTWLRDITQVKSSSLLLDGIIERSLRDLHMLRSRIGDDTYFSAGRPVVHDPVWARQSHLGAADAPLRSVHREADPANPGQVPGAGRQTSGARKSRARSCTRSAWANWQGPGAVPHKPVLRHCGRHPPCFVILASLHHDWTGDEELLEELRPSIDAAADWMSAGDRAAGYITYESTSPRGLTNQGWKDSENGVQNSDGSAAVPPIALVEVQAYAYRAPPRACRSVCSQRPSREIRSPPARGSRNSKSGSTATSGWTRSVATLWLWEETGGRRPCARQTRDMPLWGHIADDDKAQGVRRRPHARRHVQRMGSAHAVREGDRLQPHRLSRGHRLAARQLVHPAGVPLVRFRRIGTSHVLGDGAGGDELRPLPAA